MSNQPQTGVSFSIAAELQPCRLLELPPDLVEYIASSSTHSLHFKASDASDSESFLCTTDKTYHLRQVHTSNSVYITSPTPGDPSDLHPPGITAVSKCGSILEALPAPEHHARSILNSLLTPFIDVEHIETASTQSRAKEDVFAHTPMSHGECQTAWKDVFAFEYSGQSFRPTAAALVRVWKWLQELAHIHNLNLADSPLQGESLDAMLEGEDEWPRALIDAVLLKLVQDGVLERKATSKWVGHNILEARQQDTSQSSSMEKSAFVTAWRDALPEAWREQVSLDMLGDSYKLSPGGKNIEFASEQANKPGKDAADPTKPAAGGKRKWHEKFAAARKQGKPS